MWCLHTNWVCADLPRRILPYSWGNERFILSSLCSLFTLKFAMHQNTNANSLNVETYLAINLILLIPFYMLWFSNPLFCRPTQMNSSVSLNSQEGRCQREYHFKFKFQEKKMLLLYRYDVILFFYFGLEWIQAKVIIIIYLHKINLYKLDRRGGS